MLRAKLVALFLIWILCLHVYGKDEYGKLKVIDSLHQILGHESVPFSKGSVDVAEVEPEPPVVHKPE